MNKKWLKACAMLMLIAGASDAWGMEDNVAAAPAEEKSFDVTLKADVKAVLNVTLPSGGLQSFSFFTEKRELVDEDKRTAKFTVQACEGVVISVTGTTMENGFCKLKRDGSDDCINARLCLKNGSTPMAWKYVEGNLVKYTLTGEEASDEWNLIFVPERLRSKQKSGVYTASIKVSINAAA